MRKILAIVLAVMMLVSALGMNAFAAASGKAYQWNGQTGAYFYIDDFGNVPAKWEFDVRLDDGGDAPGIAKLLSGNNTPVINYTNGKIGVGDSLLSFAWTKGTWYHVVFDGLSGSSTTITVNGNLVGTVAAATTSLLCANVWCLTIDNFELVTGNGTKIDDDFEDGDFDGVNTVNGVIVTLGNDPVNPGPGPAPVPDDLGWWMRIDGYAHVCKEANRCEAPVETNCGTVEFDMILLAGENGLAEMWFFDSTGGSTRLCIRNNQIGYHYTFTEAENFSSLNWGTLDATNRKHCKYVYTDENVKFYINGSHVYTVNYGCTPAMNGLVIYVTNGSVLLNNVEMYDTEDNTFYYNDFESSLGDSEGANRVHLGACDTYGQHVPANMKHVGLAPTCTEEGYYVHDCIACGQEASRDTIDALGHAFGSYAQANVVTAATASTDGVLRWTCSQCGLQANGVAPATGDYNGSIISFDAFTDYNVTKSVFEKTFPYTQGDENGRTGDTLMQGNGYGYINDNTNANYHELANVPVQQGFTVSFDFRLNETFDYGQEGDYGHKILFWFGGQSLLGNTAGYDFDNSCFFVANEGNVSFEEETAPYTISAGQWYNITFKFIPTAYDAAATLYVNGTQVLTFEDEALHYNDGTQYFPVLFRAFGVNGDYTNLVVGDKDFMWTKFRTPHDVVCEHQWGAWVETTPAQVGVPGEETRTCALCGATQTRATDPLPDIPVLLGDVNGDGVVTSKDSRALKQYLVGALGDNDINMANADVNEDGDITSKDARALKALLVS
ncbi:MAG: hypothetical protein IJT70_01015 [Clostridia bacterium]|nr:hypothetical protein [Clostridia bacterium]